ncbi:MAG: YceI family protein [Rhodoferax sp.]|nr:YceI family protein [Rhodoferax sp.]
MTPIFKFLSRPALALTATLTLAATVQAAPYQAVQLDKSKVSFSYKQMGVGMDGHFAKFTPQLSFDPAKPEQTKASIEIDLASIDTGSGEADQEVVGKSWFNTSAFPKALFVAKQVQQTAPNQYDVLGTLTLKGRARDVKFTMKHSPQGKSGVLSGSFTLQRADYAIGEGMWSKFDVVANDIQVSFQITALTGK